MNFPFFRHSANPLPHLEVNQRSREPALLMALSVLVGLASGVSAILLSSAVHAVIRWLQQNPLDWWVIFLPGLGAMLSVLFLHRLGERGGHGVPDLIHSVLFKGGALPKRLMYTRLVSSFLTVGSGGSAGLEGPIATSGGAIGSSIGNAFHFNERRRTLLVGYGVAGAVAAIFNAPLTGTMFALEVILGEWSTVAVLPTFVSAVSATQASRIVLGNVTTFSHPIFTFSTPDLLACIPLGIVTGVVSTLFQWCLSQSEYALNRVNFPAWGKAALGGIAVGAIGLQLPGVLHDGYDTIRQFLNGIQSFDMLWVIGFLVAKFVACILTLSSGGSGGVFAPSLVLGSATGYGFGLAMRALLPTLGKASPQSFALVGMAGMVSGLMHAPLTGMFLALEITNSYNLILPLMIVSATAIVVSQTFQSGSIYTHEMIRKGEFTRRGSDIHLLNTMTPGELVDPEDIVLHEGTLLEEFVEHFKHAKRNVFPVLDSKQHWLGVVQLDDIRPYLFDKHLYSIITMGSVMHSHLPRIMADESASSAIQKFESSGAWALPVVHQTNVYIGMMSKSTLFDRYRRELIVHTEG